MRPNDIKDKKIEWFHEDYKYFKGIYLKKYILLIVYGVAMTYLNT